VCVIVDVCIVTSCRMSVTDCDDDRCENCDKLEADCTCIPDSVCRVCFEEIEYCECSEKVSEKIKCFTCGLTDCRCRRDWWDTESENDTNSPVVIPEKPESQITESNHVTQVGLSSAATQVTVSGERVVQADARSQVGQSDGGVSQHGDMTTTSSSKRKADKSDDVDDNKSQRTDICSESVEKETLVIVNDIIVDEISVDELTLIKLKDTPIVRGGFQPRRSRLVNFDSVNTNVSRPPRP
jgi:hypothetical protein